MLRFAQRVEPSLRQLLGESTETQEELDHANTAVDRQLAAYKRLVAAIDGATSDPKVTSALEAFEPLFFNNMTLVLDRYFVHRIRMVSGKDGNPLNEVELITDSLMNNDGVLRGNNVIELIPDESSLQGVLHRAQIQIRVDRGRRPPARHAAAVAQQVVAHQP